MKIIAQFQNLILVLTKNSLLGPGLYAFPPGVSFNASSMVSECGVVFKKTLSTSPVANGSSYNGMINLGTVITISEGNVY